MVDRYVLFLTVFIVLQWNCLASEINAPNTVLQYGIQSTADRYQFQILCIIMSVLHEDEISSVSCQDNIQEFKKYRVITMQHNSDNVTETFPSGAWIFVTSSLLRAQLENKFSNINENKFRIFLVGESEMLVKRKHYIAYDYQSIFELENDKMMPVLEYLRYWDILAICGYNMNSHSGTLVKNLKMQDDDYCLSKIACDIYNSSVVQQLFQTSYVYQRFSKINSFQRVLGAVPVLDCQKFYQNARNYTTTFPAITLTLDRTNQESSANTIGINYFSPTEKLLIVLYLFTVLYLILRKRFCKHIGLSRVFRFCKGKHFCSINLFKRARSRKRNRTLYRT